MSVYNSSGAYSYNENNDAYADYALDNTLRLGPDIIMSITASHKTPSLCIELLHEFIDTCPYSAKTNDSLFGFMMDLREANLSTYYHCVRTGWYSLECAKAIGLSDKECRDAMLCGFLHDIGKIETPESILQKKGKLSKYENRLIRRHPADSKRYLCIIKDFPKELSYSIGAHHEKLNGTGYPDGLVGDAIPLLARITAIADIYDAITSNRPYKKACTHIECIKIMLQAVSDGELDSYVFIRFVERMDSILAGTNPALESNTSRIAFYGA